MIDITKYPLITDTTGSIMVDQYTIDTLRITYNPDDGKFYVADHTNATQRVSRTLGGAVAFAYRKAWGV